MITEQLINTFFDYSILGTAVILFGFLAWNRYNHLEKQVKILSQIVVLQSSAIAEIKGFVVASDKFETNEKDSFLSVFDSLHSKVQELYNNEKK